MVEVKECGIYETRGGRVRRCSHISAGCAYLNEGPSGVWFDTGCVVRGAEGPNDLIREVIVGPGWRPHNGDENPAPGMVVEVMYRCGETNSDASDALGWRRAVHPRYAKWDILAYRIIGRPDVEANDEAKPDVKVADPTFFPAKLRADLPDRINIDKADNGGFIIARGDFLEFGRPKIIAALTSGKDLLAWLTQEVKANG